MTSTLPEDAMILLPDDGESVRCAEHARQIGVAPGGTAISADVVVLVETPRPWPKPVFDHPLLHGLSSMMDLHVGTARVLAVEPRSDAGTPVVTVYERGEVGAIGTVFGPPDGPALGELLEQLQSTHPSEITQFQAGTAPELAVLVCTQGSHDICCGSDGVRLANELEQRAAGLAVYRVSHTGGHRFAPTAMTLPDGRMWADISVEELLAVLDLTGDAATLADKCRGWWGAPTGPGQVAEVELLRRLGWTADMLPRDVTVEENDDGWNVTIDAARDLWAIEVRAGRIVPTIACRAGGGLPAKPGREYTVTGVTSPG